VSADFRTEHFKGYHRPDGEVPYIHVTPYASGSDYAIGDFTLGDIGELVQMAGMAWPSCPGVEVRYVIEARRPGQAWRGMWSALLGIVGAADLDETAEEFALSTFAGLSGGGSGLEWRLVRRTTVASDEILTLDTQTCPGGC
jgi:hypothetical protein